MLNERERTPLRERVVVSIDFWTIIVCHTNIGLPVGNAGRVWCLLTLLLIGKCI